MTVGAWVVGLVCLTCTCAPPYLGARRLVRRLGPDVDGPPAVLASVVVTLVLITLVSEALGSVGQFRRWPLAAGGVLVGALAAAGGRPNSGRHASGKPDPATMMAAALAAAVFARWAIGSWTSLQSGIFTEDSIQYHLPFAAAFAQSGWLSRFHYAWLDPVWTFYPYGSEVFHAIGMAAFGRDVLSPVLNMGWLALWMLAAWCCGLRWGAGPLSLAIGGVVGALPILTLSQPGSANSDEAALALLLSTTALLLTAADTSGGYLLAGLAAGLAASTTLYALPPVIGLAVGVAVFDRRGVPGRLRLGALGLVVAGGYWYGRNLIRLGNPFPGFRAGPVHLPAPRFPIVDLYGFSVAHYLPDTWFWTRYIRPGLHTAFGPGWPILALLALAGVVGPWMRPLSPRLRAVWAGGAVAAVVYVFTPTSAYGPANHPFLFAANLRFLLPSFCWFMVLGGVWLVTGRRPAWMERRLAASGSDQAVWVGAAVILGLVTLAYPNGADHQWRRHALVAVGAAAAALLVLALIFVSRRRVRVLGAVGLVAALVGVGLPVADRYLAHRYSSDGPVYRWARNVRGADIGIVAFAEQYPLFGVDLANRVSYVGTPGPHASLVVAASCGQWRHQLAQGRYDFVVIGDNDWGSGPIPQLAWTASDPAAAAAVSTSPGDRGPRATVFRLRRGADTTAGCPA
ncbi:MAG TPA: hypothetical protein VFP54_13080 [Acidimicrobiales bacterium]|nr:hypothetical protein [Acidimicrobiales bacterium]